LAQDPGQEGNPAYSVFTNMAFAFLGSWIGVPAGVTAAAYDTVKSGIMKLIPGSRQKIT